MKKLCFNFCFQFPFSISGFLSCFSICPLYFGAHNIHHVLLLHSSLIFICLPIILTTYYCLNHLLFFICPPIVPSGVPRDLVAVVISSSAVNLSWQSLLPEEQNGIIIRYVVDVTTVETGEGFELVSVLHKLTVNSLHPHWTYIFTVSGETSVGVGPPSLAVTASTLEDGKSVVLFIMDLEESEP